MHSSKIFLIILFLAGILFLNGCSKVDTSTCDDNPALSDTPTKIDCYRRLAAETLNSDVCDKIKELKGSSSDELLHAFEDGCRLDVIYYSNSSNSKACKTISTPLIQGTCYSYTAIQSETPSLCLKAAKIIGPERERQGGGSTLFQDCFATIAVKKKDMQLCNTILQYVDAEYTQLFCTSCSEPSIKENFETFMPSDCFMFYARQAKDPAACAFVAEGQKDYCYQTMALLLEDESYCRNISLVTPFNPQIGTAFGALTLHDSCFQDLAVRKKNKQICDNIAPTDFTNATNTLSVLFPQGQIRSGDPLSRRKDCYAKVDQALGIATPTAAQQFFDDLQNQLT